MKLFHLLVKAPSKEVSELVKLIASFFLNKNSKVLFVSKSFLGVSNCVVSSSVKLKSYSVFMY